MLSPDEVLTRIDALPTREDKERDYIGASEIGSECTRYLWLRFHRYIHSQTFPPRLLRLFQRGHDEEIKFQAMLEAIGFKVVVDCFDQQGFRTGFFASSGADGILEYDSKLFVAEYKTHSKKWFDTLVVGTLSKTFPKHYAQAQVGMGKNNAEWAIYMAVCKDDDRLFCDIIPFNQKDYDALCARADYIATTDKPPERIASKATAFQCKFCPAHAVCWSMELPRVHCNNCTSVTKDVIGGAFGCELEKPHMNRFPPGKQCNKHSFNPYTMQEIFNWQPIEFFPKERAVQYTLPSGEIVINGEAPFGIESKELKID